MRNEDFTPCSPGGYCGSCATPCFLARDDAFATLIERGPEDGGYEDLSNAVEDTDTFALKCARWDDPEAVCPTDVCAWNFFCFYDYQDPYPEADR